MEREYPTESLFEDMADLYDGGGVSDECLRLQHEYDADIPLLLICVLLDRVDTRVGRGAFEAWLAEARTWLEGVVKPLRAVRTTLKPLAGQAEANALRERVKACEIEAERLHVGRLVQSLPHGGGVGDLAARYLVSLGMTAEEGERILMRIGGGWNGAGTHSSSS